MLRKSEGSSAIGTHGKVSYGITDILSGQTYFSLDVLGRGHIQGALGLFRGFENKNVIELYGGYGYDTNLYLPLNISVGVNLSL
jgi:hypothetical protein